MEQGNHSAKETQSLRLDERKRAASYFAKIFDTNFLVEPGVYPPNVDTELMVETINISHDDTFLEIGCGTGAVSILISPKCKSGIATDINPRAISNAQKNAERLSVTNIKFLIGNGYSNIDGKFNVLICNPPYNNYPARDTIDRMFWDPDDEVKHSFFKEARSHLLPNGRVYFGWSDFKDININLPLELASKHGLALKRCTERPSHSKKYKLYTLEFLN